MTPQPIRTLRARVSRDAAIEAFEGGVAGSMRRFAYGPLRAIADVYVPFTLCEVIVRRHRRQERAVLGIDAVAGALDVYRFEVAPEDDELVTVRTRNHVAPALSPPEAREILTARVTRMLYRRVGFFVGGRAEVHVRAIDDCLYVPYWTGFFGRGDAAASLVIIDAVRREIEGVKVRRLITEWIQAPGAAPLRARS